jgi:hypothetical protein
MMNSTTFCHALNRTFPIEAFTRVNVHQVCNIIQLLLTVYRQLRALGQGLANHAVNVLVAAALPGAMWGVEVNSHSGIPGDLGVFGHLPPSLIGHVLMHRQRHPVERLSISDDFAPLVVIIVTVPITYVLSFFVFVKSSCVGYGAVVAGVSSVFGKVLVKGCFLLDA